MAWQRKNGRVTGRRAEVLIDLRFRETAPVRDLPVLHRITVFCRQPVHRDQFIPAEEEPTMLEIERKLIEIAHRLSHGWAVYVIRLISEGVIQYHFYARDTATLDGLSVELKQSFPDYRVEESSASDPDWTEYKKYLAAPG